MRGISRGTRIVGAFADRAFPDRDVGTASQSPVPSAGLALSSVPHRIKNKQNDQHRQDGYRKAVDQHENQPEGLACEIESRRQVPIYQCSNASGTKARRDK